MHFNAENGTVVDNIVKYQLKHDKKHATTWKSLKSCPSPGFFSSFTVRSGVCKQCSDVFGRFFLQTKLKESNDGD